MAEGFNLERSPVNIGIIFSGGGTTAEAVTKATEPGGALEGLVNVRVGIATRESAGGIDKLKKLGIPTIIRDSRGYRRRNESGRWTLDVEAYGHAIMTSVRFFEDFAEVSLDGLAQLGSIPQTSGEIIEYFPDPRFIINQHPGALDPTHLDSQGRRLDFGGRGMMGSAVTAAALDFYWRTGQNPFTESTVHTVASEIDGGQILSAVRFDHAEFRTRVAPPPYYNNYEGKLKSATKCVQEALLKVEHQNVINTLAAIARGEARVFRREGPLIDEKYADDLYRSRELARRLYPQG